MRSRLGKPLRKAFRAEFQKRFPDLKQVKGDRSPYGGPLYARNWEGCFTAYVDLQLHDMQDTFAVNLAGSVKDRYPYALWDLAWFDGRERSYGVHDRAPCKEFNFRLPELWPPHRDFWWPVTSFQPPDLLDPNRDPDAFRRYLFDPTVEDSIQPNLLEQSLADVFQKLSDYAMPYFAAVSAAIAKHGVVPLPRGLYPEYDDEEDE